MKKACLLIGAAMAVLFAIPNRLMAFPATIDSDVLIDSDVSQTSWYSQLGEGWLHLQIVTGSQTRYKGTFTDNLGKGVVYPASADVSVASAPILTLQTHVGKIVFQMDANFGAGTYSNTTTTSFPPRLGPGAQVFAAAYPHLVNSRTFSLSLNTFIGPAGPKAAQSGVILTLLSDGISYIMPKDPVTKATSFTFVPSPHPVTTHITAPGCLGISTNTMTDLSAIYVTVSLQGRFVTLLGKTANSGASYDGNVIGSGAGTAEVIGTFHMDRTSGPTAQ